MSLAAPQVEDVQLIVRVGTKRCAVPARSVREIAPLPRLTHVPLAPPVMLGLGSVRGETLAVLSFAALVDPEREKGKVGARQLLVLDGPLRVALAIDRIERLERAPRARASSRARSRTRSAITVPPLDELIANAIPPRAASHRTTAIAPAIGATQPVADRIALLCFTVGAQNFALPLDDIFEVMRVPTDIAALPGADDAVIGSIRWRDTTLGVLSLAALLGLSPMATEADASGRIIIVALGSQHVGLWVERLGTVIRVAHDRLDAVPPSLLRTGGEARISAIYRPGDAHRLVSVLAADQLLSEALTQRLLSVGRHYRQVGVALMSGATTRIAVLPVWMGDMPLALPLTDIKKVLRRPAAITRIPGTAQWLIGIAMIDGAPLILVDQVWRLTGAPASGARQRLLVIEAKGMRVGFLVSGVGRIIHADSAAITAAPLPDALADGIFGDALQVGQDDAAPLLLINPSAMVSSAERAMIAQVAQSSPGATA